MSNVSSRVQQIDPHTLAELVDAEAEHLGAREMLTSRKASRLREKWCAAKFGMGYAKTFAPCLIDIADLDEQREFDFHLVSGESRLPFQLAEVQSPGRRRGVEFRELDPRAVASYWRSQPPLSGSAAIHHIRESVQAKVDKRYAEPKKLNVLLYMNLDIASLNWSAVSEALGTPASAFSSVWLLADHAFTCAYGGEQWPPSRGWHSLVRES
jgi:hypothetical protein